MIPARKTRLFDAWFSGHAKRRIEAYFDSVHVHGLAEARRLVEAGPVLVVANHTSWWDPLVAIFLSRFVLGTDGYALMDAKNLRRLPFFAKVGGFGVDLDRADDGAAAIRYAARLLDRPRRVVFVFPQGRERPFTQRPLGFRAGSAEIARVAKAPTLPLALRYEHGDGEKPRLVLAFGEPIAPLRDVASGRALHEQGVVAALDRVDAALVGDALASFEVVASARPRRFAAFAERVLAFVTRFV